MACLADQSRFRIVFALAGAEQCVSDLARQVGLSQSCTTRHLQSLARRGLVRGSRRGRQVVFSLCFDSPEIRLVLGAHDPDPNGAAPVPTIDESLRARPRSPRDSDLSGPLALDLDHPEASDFTGRLESDPESHEPRPLHPRSTDLEDYLL